MICKTCNQEIGNARFCPNCGTENVVPTPVMQETPVMTPPIQQPMQNSNFYPNNQENNFAQPTNQNLFQQEQANVMPQTPSNDQLVAPQQNFVQQENNFVAPVQPESFQPQNNVEPNYQQFNPNMNNGYANTQQPQYQPQQTQNYQPQAENQFNVGHMNTTPQAPAVNYDKINDPAKGKATAALIWGIVALFTGWIAGIIALVCANKYEKSGNGANKGNAKAGKIMGIIGIVGGVLVTIVAIIIILLFGAGISALLAL